MSTTPPPDSSIAQELRELGELFKRAVQAAREHPNVKDFDQKISQAMNDLGAQIDSAAHSAAQSAQEPLKSVGAHVKQAAQAYKDTGAPEDFARGIAKSVRLLNEQIRKAIEELEKGSKPQE
jgi:hypothetical protein